MKTFKQFFYENREYQVDDFQQEEYLEYQSEFVYDYEAMMGLPHDKLASIITKAGNKRFSATIDGVDPSVDGTEHYYVVTDRDVLKNIASLIASTGEPHHEEFAMGVGTGDSFEFMVRLPKSGFTGEEIGDMQVFLVTPGGSDQLHALLSQVREGLWTNINAKKKRGGKSAKKGSKAYKAAKKAGDKLEATKESVWKPGDLGVQNWGEYEAGGRHAELGAIEPHMEKIPGPDRVVAHMNGLQNEYMRVLKTRKSNPDVKDNYKYVRNNIDQAIQMMNQTTGGETESRRSIIQDIHIAGFAARRYIRAIESGETNQAYYKRLLNHLRDAADAMEGLIEQEVEGELGGWNVNENFKDGKKKGKSRPGRVKRAGASCNGSVTSLRKKAKAGGEKGKMYHWCANMKSGRKKKK